jgi:hypothetical protein
MGLHAETVGGKVGDADGDAGAAGLARTGGEANRIARGYAGPRRRRSWRRGGLRSSGEEFSRHVEGVKAPARLEGDVQGALPVRREVIILSA